MPWLQTIKFALSSIKILFGKYLDAKIWDPLARKVLIRSIKVTYLTFIADLSFQIWYVIQLVSSFSFETQKNLILTVKMSTLLKVRHTYTGSDTKLCDSIKIETKQNWSRLA